MFRHHSCVSLHCDQCADTPPGPGFESHAPDETAAVETARAAGWRAAPDGRLLCPACGPILACQARGHEFTTWAQATAGPGEGARVCGCDPDTEIHLLGSADCRRQYRYCRCCCVHESRLAPRLGEVA